MLQSDEDVRGKRLEYVDYGLCRYIIALRFLEGDELKEWPIPLGVCTTFW